MRTRDNSILVDVIINDRDFNNRYKYSKHNYDMVKQYRKNRFIGSYKFMKIEGKKITFIVYKSTIGTILRTIKSFSIKPFQYNIELMENCSSLQLNQLRPYSCSVLCKELSKDVKIVTMFSYEIGNNTMRNTKPLIRLLDPLDTRDYSYHHLLFIPKDYSIEDLINVNYSKYVAMINFESTYSETEYEQCVLLFPRLMLVDADNSMEKISYAYKELMKMYQ